MFTFVFKYNELIPVTGIRPTLIAHAAQLWLGVRGIGLESRSGRVTTFQTSRFIVA